MPVAATDLDTGSFSDTPPWTIDDLDAPVWREGLAEVRARVVAEVPALTTPGRWPPGHRLVTVTRRLGTAVALWALRERRAGDAGRRRAGISRRLRLAAEKLGPTYIKLGQIISSGEGIFPAELVAEFKLCRDRVPAEPFRLVREVIEADLGRPLDEVFRWVDRTPLAAASIAQVHAATLRTGERVVVKVQRPTVATLVHDDLRVMAWLAPKLVGRIPIAALANPPALVELFAQTIAEELDFRLEAENMLDIAHTFAELGQRGYVVPRPHPTLVTPRVLVMERLDGFRFDDVAGMRDAGVDTRAVVRTGMIGFIEGAILHGIFHGDLHGGNLFVMPDGRTALLDFGITGRLDETKRLAFLRLLMGGSANDVMGQLAALRDLGALPADADLDLVFRELRLDGPVVDPTTMTGDQLVAELQQVIKALLGLGARMPKELMLFVKNMVFVDSAIATLAPDLDLFGEIAELSLYFATRHGDRIMADVGIDPRTVELDLDGFKASFGVDPATEQLTHRELQARRETIRRNLAERPRSRPGPRPRRR
ncbi:MAG TPA: AarF/UbiB family protein [Acidimicrobiales bacterium]|nr:AarF/UbiB family protein [Acidimicrobiales bacterium]